MIGRRDPRRDARAAQPPKGHAPLESLIGQHTRIDGRLTVEGNLRVDGHVQGEIASAGDVVIGEPGCVHGNICSHHVVIAGEVRGDILATGRLFGNARAGSLVIEEGGLLEGYCERHTGEPVALSPVPEDSEPPSTDASGGLIASEERSHVARSA